MKQSYIKNGIGGKIFDVCNVLLMLVLIIVMLYPFWNQLVLSFNDGVDARQGGLYFLPRAFTLANYEYVITEIDMFGSLFMSVSRVVIGTVTSLFFSGLLAYITTVKFFSGRRIMRVVFITSMYVSGGMIPVYLWYQKLGLVETFTVYWLPGLFSAYYMMILAAYMYDLPEALSESARIDGARELTIYFKVIAPLCLPAFAALSIMCAVGHWNSWFDVMLYNPSGAFDTLQMKLRNVLLEAEQLEKLMSAGLSGDAAVRDKVANLTTTSVRAATTMVVTIPIVCVYPFFQKYFVTGLSVGAVKG